MSHLADELARRAEPDRLKALASEKAAALKERAREVATHKATELKQHAKEAAVEKATELKTQARETVMQRSMELKERADTPKGWSLLGALVGAGVGSALMRKAFTRRAARQYDESDGGRDERWRYDGPRAGRDDLRSTREEALGAGIGGIPERRAGGEEALAGMRASASDKAHEVKGRAADKATELRERTTDVVHKARERASHMRERVPSREDVQHRASDWFDRTADEQPLLLAVGGITLGMLASTLLPVTGQERKLVEPAKRRAKEGVSQLGGQLHEKLQGEEQPASGGVGGPALAPSEASSVSASRVETTRQEDSRKTH
ncbi:hypothetical protein [Corallococcus macrosporus]|nr:hypothetical protein [Corallococcus macrosporus]